MTGKLVTISPEHSVRSAIERMEQYRIGCLPVLENDRLVGLVTSRDVKLSHPNRLVADAMSRNLITMASSCSLWEAEQLLNQYKIEHLIIVEKDSPVGVVTKAQLYAELGKHIDGLTGLRKADFLKYKALELLKTGKEICIIFFDLDNFGTVDKELGHIIGDEILVEVARIMTEQVDAKTDYLCRYAGDEFAIVSTKHLEGAKQLANRILTALGKDDWPYGIRVTASGGIAGGQRSNCRNDDLNKAINNLINMASLASTKAKKESASLSIKNVV